MRPMRYIIISALLTLSGCADNPVQPSAPTCHTVATFPYAVITCAIKGCKLDPGPEVDTQVCS